MATNVIVIENPQIMSVCNQVKKERNNRIDHNQLDPHLKSYKPILCVVFWLYWHSVILKPAQWEGTIVLVIW